MSDRRLDEVYPTTNCSQDIKYYDRVWFIDSLAGNYIIHLT
jgi:hypothetical protein